MSTLNKLSAAREAWRRGPYLQRVWLKLDNGSWVARYGDDWQVGSPVVLIHSDGSITRHKVTVVAW